MSDAQRLIAEVIGAHRYDISDVRVHRCVCGDDIGRDDDALDNHRAAEVDAALGGLTARVQSRAVGPAGAQTHWSPRAASRGAEFAIATFPEDYDRIEHRRSWLSGWTPEETN